MRHILVSLVAPLSLLLLVLLLRAVLHRAVDRMLRARSARTSSERVRTLASALKTTLTSLLSIMAAATFAARFGWNLAPLLTGAGVAGVALSLGAQILVRDLVSGTALLLDGQFALGDRVVINQVSGTVEQVALRFVKVRDAAGVLWTIPSGEIRTLGNAQGTVS